MSPPLPPSPPEGPPRGTYFSLRKATQPLPPSPALMEILASSADTSHLIWKRSKKAYARVGSKEKNTRPRDRARIGKRNVSWLLRTLPRTQRGPRHRPRILPLEIR